MKKRLSVFLAGMLCIGLLAGCGTTETKATTAQSNETKQSAVQTEPGDESKKESGEKERIKIGVTSKLQSPDPVTQAKLNIYKDTAEALNIELVSYEAFDYSAESEIAAVETFISMGCKGIYFYSAADSALPTVQKMCSEAGVYYMSNAPIGDEMLQKVSEDPYFLGYVCEENYQSAYDMVGELADLGSKNIVVLSVAEGNAYARERHVAVKQACEDKDIKILKYFQELTSADDISKAVESCVVAYPEMDGIFIECSYTNEIVPATIKVLQNNGLTDKVNVGGFDHGNATEYIGNEVDFIYGGMQQTKNVTGLAALANYIRGDIEKLPEGDFMEIRVGAILFKTYEEMEKYAQYCEDPSKSVFPKETLLEYMEGADEKQFQEFCNKFSLEFLDEIHK